MKILNKKLKKMLFFYFYKQKLLKIIKINKIEFKIVIYQFRISQQVKF